MKEWRELMDERGTRTRHADEAAGRRARARTSCSPTTRSSPPTSGTITTWAARHIDMRGEQMFSLLRQPGDDGERPALRDRRAGRLSRTGRCVAFVGDGGFTMLMGEFATCVKYKLPIKVVVIKNNTLGQIKWEQMVFLGNPEYGVRAAADRLRRRRRGLRRARLHDRRPGELRRDPARGAGARRARR